MGFSKEKQAKDSKKVSRKIAEERAHQLQESMKHGHIILETDKLEHMKNLRRRREH